MLTYIPAYIQAPRRLAPQGPLSKAHKFPAQATCQRGIGTCTSCIHNISTFYPYMWTGCMYWCANVNADQLARVFSVEAFGYYRCAWFARMQTYQGLCTCRPRAFIHVQIRGCGALSGSLIFRFQKQFYTYSYIPVERVKPNLSHKSNVSLNALTAERLFRKHSPFTPDLSTFTPVYVGTPPIIPDLQTLTPVLHSHQWYPHQWGDCC
jgi:hypothetical protein